MVQKGYMGKMEKLERESVGRWVVVVVLGGEGTTALIFLITVQVTTKALVDRLNKRVIREETRMDLLCSCNQFL